MKFFTCFGVWITVTIAILLVLLIGAITHKAWVRITKEDVKENDWAYTYMALLTIFIALTSIGITGKIYDLYIK